MRLTDEQIAVIRDGCDGVTVGEWAATRFGQTARTVRVAGGKPIAEIWHSGSEAEMDANAAHIARCDPDTVLALATEVLETRALLAFFDEERLEEIITDSIDLDWTPRTAARAIVRAMKGAEITPPEAK